MRPLALALLATTLAACADAPDAPADPPALRADVPAPPAPPAPGVRIDSLVRDEPDLLYTVDIGYPQLDGDAPEVAAVNAAIRDSVEALADDFRPSEPPPAYDAPTFEVDVDGTTERTFLTDGLFSALVSTYAYTGGAHGNTFFLPLTYDLTTGQPVRLADLFAEGSAYGDTLAAWAERDVLRRLAAGLGVPPGEARGAFYAEGLAPVRRGDAYFTLGADSLHLHIPPYQLSAYAAGSFDVGVPYGALRPLARPGGPLDRLAEAPRQPDRP